MKKSVSVWDIIAWIVLALILIWLILKVTGIINTPILIEYAPYFGAVYLAGWQIHKLEMVARDVQELKIFKKETINEIHKIKENCAKNH
jgi:hypothetical protein